MQIWRTLRRILSFDANIPRAVLGTRVNPDVCRIRAGTGKFDLNTDFFFADFKSIWIEKYYVIYSLQALSEKTWRTQDQEFLLSFFQLSSDEKLLEEFNDVNLLRLVIHSFFWQITYSGTSWYNEPLCNEVLDITNDFLYSRNSKILENQPRYNETLL